MNIMHRDIDRRAFLKRSGVTAGEQVPEAAAEVGAAQHGVQGDRGQQDTADRRGRHHSPPQPAPRSCGTDGGP